MNKEVRWYGVKLLYVYKVTGEPDPALMDRDYIDGYFGYEESVIIVQANDFDEAFDKAEAFARENEDEHTNLYGQTVKTKFYDFIDCYWIPANENVQWQDGVEVYSNIIDSHISISPEEFMQKHFPVQGKVHYMLLNGDLPLS